MRKKWVFRKNTQITQNKFKWSWGIVSPSYAAAHGGSKWTVLTRCLKKTASGIWSYCITYWTGGRHFSLKFLPVWLLHFVLINISKSQGILYIKPESISQRNRTIFSTICAYDLLFQKNIHFNLSPEFWKFSKNSPSPPSDHISTYSYFHSITISSLNLSVLFFFFPHGFVLVWVTLSCAQFSSDLELGDLQLSHWATSFS